MTLSMDMLNLQFLPFILLVPTLFFREQSNLHLLHFCYRVLSQSVYIFAFGSGSFVFMDLLWGGRMVLLNKSYLFFFQRNSID